MLVFYSEKGNCKRELETYMSPEQQRIKIAEACGWKRRDYVNCHGVTVQDWVKENEVIYGTENLPDYLNDLNAMHEAEKVLNREQIHKYLDELEHLVARDQKFLPTVAWLNWLSLHATAVQRAEAFLKTLGIWKEEPVSAVTVEGLR